MRRKSFAMSPEDSKEFSKNINKNVEKGSKNPSSK